MQFPANIGEYEYEYHVLKGTVSGLSDNEIGISIVLQPKVTKVDQLNFGKWYHIFFDGEVRSYNNRQFKNVGLPRLN